MEDGSCAAVLFMLVWLAEHLVKYYSGFNVFSYSDVSRHRQPVDRAVHLFMDGPRMIAFVCKNSLAVVRVTMARNRTSVNAVRRRWWHHDPDGDCDFRSVMGLPV